MEVLVHLVLPCETLQFGTFAPIYSAVSIAENAPYEPSGTVFEVQDFKTSDDAPVLVCDQKLN